jgi:hypothetical protein
MLLVAIIDHSNGLCGVTRVPPFPRVIDYLLKQVEETAGLIILNIVVIYSFPLASGEVDIQG